MHYSCRHWQRNVASFLEAVRISLPDKQYFLYGINLMAYFIMQSQKVKIISVCNVLIEAIYAKYLCPSAS